MEENLELAALMKSGEQIRGNILNDVTFLEKLIDNYITSYFCSDEVKKKEFFEMISSERLSFDAKRQILLFLLETHNEDFYKTHKESLGYLQIIMRQRNVLAHYMLDTSIEGREFYKKGEIVFVRFLNKKENIHHTTETINLLKKQIDECVKVLLLLQN
jgi:hypothetical protein